MPTGKTRFFLIIAAILGFAFLFHVYRIVNLALDLRALAMLANEPSTGTGGAPVRKPTLALVKGLVPEKLVGEKFGERVSSLYSTYSGNELKPIAPIVEILKEVPDPLLHEMAQEIPIRVAKGFAKLNPPAPVPDYIDLGAPIHNFREARMIARFWYGYGRAMSQAGKHELALQTMCGIILFAQQLEADSAEGLSLITKMIGIAIRKIGATGLLEIIPYLQVPGSTFKLWAGNLLDLEAQVPSIALAYKSERMMIPSVLSPKALADAEARNDGKRIPRTLIRAVSDKAFLESYLSPCYDPQIEACNQPFATAMKTISGQSQYIENMMTQSTTPGLHWVKYIFRPEAFVMETLMAICVPNFGKALQQDFLTRQTVRGAVIALALRGYKQDNGKLPATLGELATWLGKPIPDDFFSEKPLEYHPGKKPLLFSVGLDQKPATADDMVFIPLSGKP
jgi:hypothetical protein